MADTIALTFTGGLTYDDNDMSPLRTIGWEFALSAPVTVTSLGFYDVGGDGFIESHSVAIWNVNNQNMIVMDGVVRSFDPIDQGFRWASVSPVTLAAGTYRIGASFTPGSGFDYYYGETEMRTTASPVTYNFGAYEIGSFGIYPARTGLIGNGRFGPNFQFNQVPISSTSLLFSSGLLGLVGWRRFRKK